MKTLIPGLIIPTIAQCHEETANNKASLLPGEFFFVSVLLGSVAHSPPTRYLEPPSLSTLPPHQRQHSQPLMHCETMAAQGKSQHKLERRDRYEIQLPPTAGDAQITKSNDSLSLPSFSFLISGRSCSSILFLPWESLLKLLMHSWKHPNEFQGRKELHWWLAPKFSKSK